MYHYMAFGVRTYHCFKTNVTENIFQVESAINQEIFSEYTAWKAKTVIWIGTNIKRKRVLAKEFLYSLVEDWRSVLQLTLKVKIALSENFSWNRCIEEIRKQKCWNLIWQLTPHIFYVKSYFTLSCFHEIFAKNAWE